MSVEERLEHLERKVRWMRRLGAVGVALVAAVVLMGQGKKEELPDLVARSLELKDSQGRIRLKANAGEDQDAGIRILDQKGKERLAITVGDGGCVLVLRDDSGMARVLVAWQAGGRGPFIALSDENNNERFEAGFWGKKGLPFLALRDERARARIVATTKEDGSPDLRLFGKNDKVIWQAPKE